MLMMSPLESEPNCLLCWGLLSSLQGSAVLSDLSQNLWRSSDSSCCLLLEAHRYFCSSRCECDQCLSGTCRAASSSWHAVQLLSLDWETVTTCLIDYGARTELNFGVCRDCHASRSSTGRCSDARTQVCAWACARTPPFAPPSTRCAYLEWVGALVACHRHFR